MSTEKTLPQIAKVEQPFGIEPPTVHCPICGQAMIDDGDINPCNHLAFIHAGAGCDDFEYQSDDFRSTDKAIDDDNGVSYETIKDILVSAGYDNKMLAIEITYGGMSCGPVWYTDIYGFDYGSLAGDRSDTSKDQEKPEYYESLAKLEGTDVTTNYTEGFKYCFACIDEVGNEGLFWFKESEVMKLWISKFEDRTDKSAVEKIEWIGDLQQLETSDDDWPKRVRESFRENHDIEGSGPIKTDEKEDWLEYLMYEIE
jgi:hypothetical protein